VRTRRLKNSTPQAAGAELIPGQGDHDTTHHEIILLRSDKVKVEKKAILHIWYLQWRKLTSKK